MSLSSIGGTLPGVAREAIRAHLTGAALPLIDTAAPRAGVFVTLRNADGSLRGCVGSVEPREPDIIREGQRSAILAATGDPRFVPVALEELDGLHVDVSVLSPAERVSSPAELDPSRYGVIVCDETGRRGLLLPGIAGVDTVERQVAVARQKAGIVSGARVQLSRFAVDKWSEAGRVAREYE